MTKTFEIPSRNLAQQQPSLLRQIVLRVVRAYRKTRRAASRLAEFLARVLS